MQRRNSFQTQSNRPRIVYRCHGLFCKSYARIKGANERVGIVLLVFDRFRQSLLPSFMYHYKELNFDILAGILISGNEAGRSSAALKGQAWPSDVDDPRHDCKAYTMRVLRRWSSVPIMVKLDLQCCRAFFPPHIPDIRYSEDIKNSVLYNDSWNLGGATAWTGRNSQQYLYLRVHWHLWYGHSFLAEKAHGTDIQSCGDLTEFENEFSALHDVRLSNWLNWLIS